MTDGDRNPRGARRGGGGYTRRIAGRASLRWAAGIVACSVACCLPAVASAAALTGSTLDGLGPVNGTPHGLGLIPTPEAPASRGVAAAVSAAATSLPASVDLTQYAMPVGNQGDVGSCAAWATDYTALGYWENKQGIAGGALEPMYTYSQLTGGVDDGSSIEGNLQVDEQQGVDTQSDYWQGNFNYSTLPTTAEKAHAVNWKLTSFNDLAINPSSASTVTQQSLETALAAGTPVVIGIPVYDNFFYVTSANNGYYSGPSGRLDGYHAITALGYSAGGLVIENSWGTGWGNSGYATLSWAFVNADVFDAVAVGPLTTGQPVSTAAPAVTGTAREGQALTASTGAWSPAATSYAYQWQRAANGSSAWSAVTGATGSTYVPTAADLGNNLRVLVTATDSKGQGAAVSAPVGQVTVGGPANTTAPSAGGTLRVGQTLTASPGAWSPAATSYAYQWQRSTNSGSTWTNISGATGISYATGAADAGAYERVQVTATNSYGTGTATSAALGPVSGVPDNTVAPTVTGTLRQGQTLTAAPGGWSPAGTSYAYQWQRSTNGGVTWVSVSGMTGTTYVLEAADVGNRVRVQVTATNSSGQAQAFTAVGPIASAVPIGTGAPVVSGTAKVGDKLTANAGSWSQSGLSYIYQWQRNSGSGWQNISGATASTYTLVASEAGDTLRIVVQAYNQFGAAIQDSAATAKVAAASASTAKSSATSTATKSSPAVAVRLKAKAEHR